MTSLFRREKPEAAVSHEPTEKRVDTITVECGRSGPEVVPVEYETYRQYSLADVETWCARLRELGAPDDLPLPEADGLSVTLDTRA